ncbi:MAG TPA: PEGA domain-containing protein [Polyangia bacterium]
MHGRGFWFLLAGMGAFAARAQAQPITHPIWATTPDVSWNDAARAQFEAAVKKRGLGPLEIVAPTRPLATRTAELFGEGMIALHTSNFVLAAALLGEAATQALESGGEGLSSKDFASLFFHQAMALQLASGATYSEPFTAITPQEAKTAYLRAAVLGAGQSLDQAANQPLVEASWRLAVATVVQRQRGRLTVRAHSRASVSIDGGALQASPASFPALPYGEHFVRVEEAGHAPWSTTVAVQDANVLIDVPATQFLLYDAAAAAAIATSRGATFALLGQLHLGDKVEIDLRLVDARNGETRDATAVPVFPSTDSPELVAAVLRLDELASRTNLTRRAEVGGAQANAPLMLATPPPRSPGESEPGTAPQPGSWLQQRWPLVTAVAVAAGTAFLLAIVVAKDNR